MRRAVYQLYRIGGWISISIALLLITLRVLVGLYSPSESQLISWAKDHFSYGINVKSAQMEFIGWNPAITLENVEVMTEDNRLALNIEKVKVVLNVYSLAFNKFVLRDVILDGMKIGVEYQPDGVVAISDLSTLKWNPKAPSSKRSSIHHLLIKNSDIHLSLGAGKSLPLAQVDLRMDSSLRFRISGSAIVVNEAPSKVEFFVDVPLLSENVTNMFCQWKGGSLAQLSTLFDKKLPDSIAQDQFNLRIWLTVDKFGENHIISEVELSNNPNHSTLRGWVNAHGKQRSWQTQSHWTLADIPSAYELIANTYPCEQGMCLDAQTWNVDIHSTLSAAKKLSMIPNDLMRKLEALNARGTIDCLSLCYEPNSTRLQVEGQAFDIHYSDWFEQPLHLNNLNVLLSATKNEELILQGLLSRVTLEKTDFSGAFSMKLEDGTIQDLEFAFESDAWPVKNALKILPRKVMDTTLVHWLDRAILEGKIAQSRFLFRGNPKDFPFDKNQGVFEANLTLDKVLLNYDNEWPVLSQLDATLLFQNRKMVVDVSKAVVEQGALVYAKATIPDLSAPLSILSVNAKINNQLDRAAAVIHKSPLRNTVGKSLSALNFAGDMQLDLGLLIPLSAKANEPVKVAGLLSVLDGSVLVPDWELKATQLKGQVAFTEKSVSSNGLAGNMLGHGVDYSISSHEHEAETKFEIQAKGRVGYHNIQQWLKLEPSEIISGDTEYVAKLSVYSDLEKHPLHLDILTSLSQLDIKLPTPLGKPLDAIRESSLSLDLVPNKSAQFNIHYGPHADLVLMMANEQSQWKFKGGHLNFSNKADAKHRTDGIFLIDGSLEELNIQDWKALLKGTSSASLSFEPLVALNVSKFILNGETFSKTNVEAQWDKTASLWNFNFDGPSIKGHVSLPEGEDKRDIVIDLAKLTLTTDNEKSSNWADMKEVLERPIEAKIKKLKIDKKVFTDFQARVEPSWKGYDFPRIKAKLKGTEIQLSGAWDAFSHIKQVTAEGKIITRNTTDAFKALGMTGTVQQAKGNIDFSLGWHGTPSKIDYPTLVGKAEFQLTNGYVLGVNPGIGRVLNLLSLDSVTRRLNLDFNDVTKNGFAFDDFTAKFQFGKGKVSTNKVSLRGPSANIEAYGQADLQNQEISGGLIVMPNVTGSLPVAAAIAAGNPAVGAAVWVVDKMVGKKLQEIHRYRYRLVGTWDAPKLEELPTVPIRRS